MRRELLRPILITVWLGLLLFAAVPAEACGCGVYIPREGEGNVVQERALIRWDGTTEDIVMALGVQGSATEAAWILPVPSQAKVQLGAGKLFETLQELTKPRVEYHYALMPPLMLGSGAAPEGVGGAPAVLLLQQQTLGPFEVSTLAATDATALSGWLADNGYNFPSGLADVLQAYVQQGWFYIAVRLTPGEAGKSLTGELDPLWITFQTTEMVYPMRATALATGRLPVYLYVLADHRVEKAQTFGSDHISFADWVEPVSLPSNSPLAPFISRKFFLTKFEEQIWNPSQVNDDFTFTFANQDEIYHDVEIEYLYSIAGIPIILLVLFGLCLVGLILVGGASWFLITWQRRRPKAA
jgi:hypothetical protein